MHLIPLHQINGEHAAAPPKLTSAELVARAQASSAERTLRRLREAVADAAALRTSNGLLREHIEVLQDERDHLVRENRIVAVALVVCAAVAGYVAGMLHAGAQP